MVFENVSAETSDPRSLLEAAGYRLVEVPGESLCCGFGGTFSLTHPSLSLEILDRKMDMIGQVAEKATGIATDCPGCLLQLEEGIRRRGTNLTIRHTALWLDPLSSTAKAPFRRDEAGG